MKLITKQLERGLPPLYAQDAKGEEALVHVKLFTPWTNWTWYVTEYDPEQRLCFGLVVGQETEFGYFALGDLEEFRGPFGFRIERDINWVSKALKDVPDYVQWMQRRAGRSEEERS